MYYKKMKKILNFEIYIKLLYKNYLFLTPLESLLIKKLVPKGFKLEIKEYLNYQLHYYRK